MIIQKIISGGQTGVDRAALDSALNHNIEIGGWCPAGRKSEDGYIPDKYLLQETKTEGYYKRTLLNIKNSDGTLILNFGELEGGTLLTKNLCEKHNKPYILVQLEQNCLDDIVGWVIENSVVTLNVAGPRGSKDENIYPLTYELMNKLLTNNTNKNKG